ncbi:uncharacterized protein LAESUDRAFT_285146 [Laetiporus sulphureus 93-53]|uniref:Uncharacterized protein n=1 Tax=Laetiporus sulphureus 93-53 TaxID=1314785 RepID=A0A165DG65_9APHY|nr:uncharacterized protein LAESUDRAFT_285146 [Laetiporus sulphureus 93-53]KZT04822.1 hypothetical protein LAESUDRAFT_285146 [Laetiporus sulphureus 93-53]
MDREKPVQRIWYPEDTACNTQLWLPCSCGGIPTDRRYLACYVYLALVSMNSNNMVCLYSHAGIIDLQGVLDAAKSLQSFTSQPIMVRPTPAIFPVCVRASSACLIGGGLALCVVQNRAYGPRSSFGFRWPEDQS